MNNIEFSIFLEKRDVHKSGNEYKIPENLFPVKDEDIDKIVDKIANGITILYLFISEP